MKTTLIIVFFIFLLIPSYSQESKIYKTLFTSRSAQIDTSVKGWGNMDDDKVLRVINKDLNGDGIPESIYTKYADCSSSGCTFTIKDGKTKNNLGEIKGATVYILNKTNNGYNDLETYIKQGFDKATVYFYSFEKGKYKEIKKTSISGGELKKYFSGKPQFTEEKKK